MEQKTLYKVSFYVRPYLAPPELQLPDQLCERYTTMPIPEFHALLEDRYGAGNIKIAQFESVGTYVEKL